MNGQPGCHPTHSLAPPTVVIVDDSKTIRTSLRMALVQSGYSVVGEGESGVDAITLYEKYRPSVMFLDIVLPGLDGVSAARTILKRHPAAKIVMCSSLTSRDEIIACQRAGIVHFVSKPFKPENIINIARVLRAAAAVSAGVAA